MGKKVMILTSVHSVFDPRIFHKQARSLSKAGYDVTLVAQYANNETVDGIKIIGLPKSGNRFQRMFGSTFRILLVSLRNRAHVYHFHDPELLPVGLILKIFTKAKVIYDVHEDYAASFLTRPWIPAFLRRSASILISIIEIISSIFFDAIILARHVSTPFPNKKTTMVTNYPILELSRFDPNRSYSEDQYTIIYTGGLSKIRGIRELVKSLDYISPNLKVRLKLLGRFTDDSEEETRSLPAFVSKVDFLGWIPHEEVYRYMEKAHIGVALFYHVPNHMNTTPNKLFEYMAAGLPIIASDIPFWKDIIEENRCGLTVDPTRPDQIAKAIEYLLSRPGLMAEMGKNGYKAVSEKYNWGQEAKKLFSIYERLLYR